jgi:hypothetical protein
MGELAVHRDHDGHARYIGDRQGERCEWFVQWQQLQHVVALRTRLEFLAHARQRAVPASQGQAGAGALGEIAEALQSP